MPSKNKGFLKLVLCGGMIVAGTLELKNKTYAEMELIEGNPKKYEYFFTKKSIEFSLDAHGLYNVTYREEGFEPTYKKFTPPEFTSYISTQIKNNPDYEYEYSQGRIKEYKDFGNIPSVTAYFKITPQNLNITIANSTAAIMEWTRERINRENLIKEGKKLIENIQPEQNIENKTNSELKPHDLYEHLKYKGQNKINYEGIG